MSLSSLNESPLNSIHFVSLGTSWVFSFEDIREVPGDVFLVFASAVRTRLQRRKLREPDPRSARRPFGREPVLWIPESGRRFGHAQRQPARRRRPRRAHDLPVGPGPRRQPSKLTAQLGGRVVGPSVISDSAMAAALDRPQFQLGIGRRHYRSSREKCFITPGTQKQLFPCGGKMPKKERGRQHRVTASG